MDEPNRCSRLARGQACFARRAAARGALATVATLALAGVAGAAPITVTTDLDADALDGGCSLREAIVAANTDAPWQDCPAGSGPDHITFALTLPAVIALSADLPVITESVAIRGPGITELAIAGGSLHRAFVFETGGGGWFGLSDLTVRFTFSPSVGGSDADAGAAVNVAPGETAVLSRVFFFSNDVGDDGGAVAVRSSALAPSRLTVEDCTFVENRTQGPLGDGGAMVVWNAAEVTIRGSGFSDNYTAPGVGRGGAIAAFHAALDIRRSTFYDGGSQFGGAIYLVSIGATASLLLEDATIASCHADTDGDGDGIGGGVYFELGGGGSGTLEVRNSIVADNHVGQTAFGPGVVEGANPPSDIALVGTLPVLTATGFNLIGSEAGAEVLFPAGMPNGNGDYVGTSATPIDPRLDDVALNGGVSLSAMPRLMPVASPALDRGLCGARAGDQRGFGDPTAGLRRVDLAGIADGAGSDGCDIGAVERDGSSGSVGELFADGFEAGHSLAWSLALP